MGVPLRRDFFCTYIRTPVARFKEFYIRLSLRRKILSGVLLILFAWFIFCLPAHLFSAPTSYVLEDKDGNLLSASIAEDGQWRFPCNANVPDKFSKCITTFEDKRFFYHPGIDPIAMSRALVQNISTKNVVSGGSTLTMQVIRLSRGTKSRNVFNKIIESVLAVRLEFAEKKETILALYASNAPFGSNNIFFKPFEQMWSKLRQWFWLTRQRF